MNILLKLIKLFPPEVAHKIALNSLNILYKLKIINLFFPRFTNQKVIFQGMSLSNRLGTAAGLDKNGDFIDCLGELGFGFLEVGTITPLPQAGNAKPRIFRVFNEEAIINRLGFNNKGLDHLVKKLERRKFQGPVGVNIGANKTSKGQKRIDDYLDCFNKVHHLADYITVNISSPNTPGLRDLHDAKNLLELIQAIEAQIKISNYIKPIFLKISPDESKESLNKIIKIVTESIFSGVIISNTSVDKNLLQNKEYLNIDGGLSGKPIMERSTQLINQVKQFSPEIPVIGVGGVMDKSDFNKKIQSGAGLVQLYSGFIIKGPKIVQDILKD